MEVPQDSSSELTEEVQNRLIFNSVINSFLSVTSFLGNALILVGLHKDSSLHAPSKLLFRNLAISDLCVGIIAEPLAVATWMLMVTEQWKILRYIDDTSLFTAYALCSVSLCTMTAISVDRLLALLLGLRYRSVVTLKRTYAILTASWVLSIVVAGMHFWNDLITIWGSYIVISLCLVTSVFCYGKIFEVLRHHQTQVQNHVHQGQPSQTVPLNIARYRKTVCNTLWVQSALVVCYLPYGIVAVLGTHIGHTSSVLLAYGFAVTLVFLNSSLNPILYCWKIREVRQAVKDIVRQFCCKFR